ncbi:MAG TPA: acetyl-CoA hydrolase/transferase C-terminal domain-containing protein [Oculatellaceae cyanobacterium]
MKPLVTPTQSWRDHYKRHCMSAEEAVSKISSGENVYIQSNAAAPELLIQALVKRSDQLRDVRIHHLMTLSPAPYTLPKYRDAFRVNALFIGGNVRDAVNDDRADYTPIFLSEIPNAIDKGIIPVDVCLLHLSMPDEHGFCSYGVSVDVSVAAQRRARIVIAQVNAQMPRTFGQATIHVTEIDGIVEADIPLPELKRGELGPIERQIGAYVASLVEDGATLQLGIGKIPDAVLSSLTDRKDLGVHTEMFSDGVVELVEAGVITNACKTVLSGKIATSFVMGTKRLYDFVDNNPSVEFATSDFINDPFVVGQNYKMTSINSAIQIDLSGQVCSGSIGTQLYSGFGGQVDFVRGAVRSKGGKAIIAIPSTAKNGKISKIVPLLAAGAGVVTSRGDVHYVVTEYGIADLYGKNLNQRAQSLIAISHPDFRENLEEQYANIRMRSAHSIDV